MLTATMLTSSLVKCKTDSLRYDRTGKCRSYSGEQFLCPVQTLYLWEEDPEHDEDPGDLIPVELNGNERGFDAAGSNKFDISA